MKKMFKRIDEWCNESVLHQVLWFILWFLVGRGISLVSLKLYQSLSDKKDNV